MTTYTKIYAELAEDTGTYARLIPLSEIEFPAPLSSACIPHKLLLGKVTEDSSFTFGVVDAYEHNAITDLLETLPKNEWYQVAIVTERN